MRTLTYAAALEHISRAIGHDNVFVDAIQTINNSQKKRFVDRLIAKLGRPIEGAKIAVVTETKEARNAVGKQLAESGKIRAPERSGIWPEHVNPADGPNADIHVQTIEATKGAGFGTSLGMGVLAIIGANDPCVHSCAHKLDETTLNAT